VLDCGYWQHYVETTLGYARLYDSTAARDYERAMGKIESSVSSFRMIDPLAGFP
jgi:hypothetical protein